MSDVRIWVMKAPYNEEARKKQEFADRHYKNVMKGIAQFAYSWIDGCNLLKFEDKKYMTELENKYTKEIVASIWKYGKWMLNVKKGDWIVYVNVPRKGFCIAAEVSETYYYIDDKEKLLGGRDGRHAFGININTIVEFDRNDINVAPIISRKLKLMGAHYRIYDNKEFFKSIEQLKNKKVVISEESTKTEYYANEYLEDGLKDLTTKIQKACPEKNLEYFLADIFRKIPNINANVKNNGSGWRTDNGADIIIEANLSIAGLDILNTIVVQVKSYTGKHSNTSAVEQLKTAINHYEANAGILITTGETTENLDEAIEKLNNDLGKPVLLMSGGDVARFVLKYNQNNL